MSMAQEALWVDLIGVDVAKGWVDTCRLATGRAERVATSKPALARFARAARGGLVVCKGEMSSAHDPGARWPIERAAASAR